MLRLENDGLFDLEDTFRVLSPWFDDRLCDASGAGLWIAKHLRLPTFFFFPDSTLSFSLHTVYLPLHYSAYLSFMLNVLQKLRTCFYLTAHFFSCKRELHAHKDWSQQVPIWALVALWDCCEPCPLGMLEPRVCVSLQKGIGHWVARRVGKSCALGDDCEVWDLCISISGLRDAGLLWCQEGHGAALLVHLRGGGYMSGQQTGSSAQQFVMTKPALLGAFFLFNHWSISFVCINFLFWQMAT